MKTTVKVALSVILILTSCDEPKTVVTNYVHPDGSVTRKIEMRSTKNKFEKSYLQVPFDGTWTIKDSIAIGVRNDTTWIKTAVKTFRNTDEINLAYKNDSGPNRLFAKRADFSKSFKWFHTEYRFSETFDKIVPYGYPVKDFLNSEELEYFYFPDELKQGKENGPDSLKYKIIADSINKKTDRWVVKCLLAGWIEEFSALTSDKGDSSISKKSLKLRENEFAGILTQNEEKFDSLWKNGVLLKEAIGENNAAKYNAEADTAMEHVVKQVLVDFKEYSERIVMPGKLIGTNGFIDSSKVLLWPVKNDYFLTQEYQIWAESKVPNAWAWIVSVVFVLFVLAGVVLRIIKKD
jgi:hypothetical protein